MGFFVKNQERLARKACYAGKFLQRKSATRTLLIETWGFDT
jgi:hypothetical protein